MQTNNKQFSDFIVPLEINGLNGRMLKLPVINNKNRDMLVVYGHHATIERFQGLAEMLNDYGSVTMADLPGFGGMESFYKIGQQPTLDNMADYLASVIKLRYKNKKFSIIAVSFGFLVATRMLQKYPEIAKKVDLLISMVGFTHHDEFKLSKSRYFSYRTIAKLFTMKIPAIFFKNVILHPFAIRSLYSKTHNAKHKFKGLSSSDKRKMIKFEVLLWRINDVRTHMFTSTIMLTVDNCQKRVDLPVWHLYVKNDNYFDNHIVEQHMRVIFNDFEGILVKMKSHSVSIIASKEESAPLVPAKLRYVLSHTS